MSQQLWSRDNLAEWLNVSKKTTYDMQRAGAIPPPTRIGQTYRWDAEIVREWIQARNKS